MQKMMQWGFRDGVDGSRTERVKRSVGRRLSSDPARGGADQSSKQRCSATRGPRWPALLRSRMVEVLLEGFL